MKEKRKTLWPYAIVGSIIFIFFAAVATVVVAVQKPVQMSNALMQDYHHVDANANGLIKAQIAFNRRYHVESAFSQLQAGINEIAYNVSTIDGNPIDDNVSMELLLTRPDVLAYDLQLNHPERQGIHFIFHDVNITKEGRWNAILHVKIASDERYYNLKLSTQYSNQFEY